MTLTALKPQAPAPLTCATCPFARHIDGDRYCCQVSQTASDVKRGHWEATVSCYEALVAVEAEEVAAPAVEGLIEVEESIEVEAPAASAPAHTAETLKTLTWNQIQKLHTSLGLKATAASRTRAHCEARILAVQSQPAVVATATTDDAPPNRGDNGRSRISATSILTVSCPVSAPPIRQAKQDDNFISAMVKKNDFDRKFYNLAYLSECQLKAQLAVEQTVIGSEDEAIALRHLAKIDRVIEFYGHPQSNPYLNHAVVQLEKQMTELKADTNKLKLFKITAFDPSIILPTHDEDLDEQPVAEIEPEGTIHWHSPLTGAIVGKKGVLRNFYVQSKDLFPNSYPEFYEIYIVISADFTAKESKSPNIRHQQIRQAIEAGRKFDPRAFKGSPQFLTYTKDYRGVGRIMQGSDGRWWAWKNGGITGHPFPSENLAWKYLDKIAEQHQFTKKA